MEIPDLTVDDFRRRNINISSAWTPWECLETVTKVAAEKFEEAKGNPVEEDDDNGVEVDPTWSPALVATSSQKMKKRVNSNCIDTFEYNRNYHPKDLLCYSRQNKRPSAVKVEPVLGNFMIVKKSIGKEPKLRPDPMPISTKKMKGRNPSRSKGKGRDFLAEEFRENIEQLSSFEEDEEEEEPILDEEESGSGITSSPNTTKKTKKRGSPKGDTLESSSKKRRTNNQRKYIPCGPTTLPERFKDRIKQLTSSKVEPVLIIEKPLTPTDCCDNQSRLSMPFGMLMNFDFLDSKEKKIVGVDAMQVRFIDPKLNESSMMLRRWDMNKDNGHSSSTYNLRTMWNRVRVTNGLGVDDVVQVWAFRDVQGVPGFALVRVPEGGGGRDGSWGGDGDGSSTSTFESHPLEQLN